MKAIYAGDLMSVTDRIARKVKTEARKALNLAGFNKKKIFAIGFNKCGTTSLHELFTSLGFLSHHGITWRRCDDLELLRSFDCFSDGAPGEHSNLTKLDNLFPGSKFILQVRDLESWIYSRLAHLDREKERGVHKGGPRWDTTEYAVKYWIEMRNSYHTFVLSYFAERPQDLLIVNFVRDEHAATKVVRFLGFDRAVVKPHRNENPRKERPSGHNQLLYDCVQELGIPEKELAYDILCPSLLTSWDPERQPYDTSLLGEESRWGKSPFGR